MKYKYPVYQPSLTGNEKKYVLECLDSTWISSKGKYVEKFENEFCDFLGVKNSTTVCNGTVALHLALLALGIGQGDEVIVPTLTYIASVNAIRYSGATPVFVDSLTESWQIDPDDIKRKITHKTKGIMCVHLYGQACEMDKIVRICEKENIFLIEDCAEALGTKFKGKMVGTFGDISTFSFYGNKTITTGEGGMVSTNDTTLFDRAVHFKGQGLAKYRQYWHDVVGYNYRMTNICAAIGTAQLERIDSTIEKKRKIANWYAQGLQGSQFSFHKESPSTFHTYWMCSILVRDKKDRDALRTHLENHGIETRPLFYPVHTMPMYSQKYEQHKTAEDLGWRGLNLPSYPELIKSDIEEIVKTILSYA